MVKIIIEIEETQNGKAIEAKAYAEGNPRSETERVIQQTMVEGCTGLLQVMQRNIQQYSVVRDNTIIGNKKLDSKR